MEQTSESRELIPYFIEEVYEVVEAVDSKDSDALQEELGDVLLHIIFQALIAEENKKFVISDVIDLFMVQKLEIKDIRMFLVMKKPMDPFMQSKTGRKLSIKRNNVNLDSMEFLYPFPQLCRHKEFNKKLAMQDLIGKIPRMYGKKSMKSLKS